MAEVVSSLVDYLARQAGIPSELAFVQEVTRLQTRQQPVREAHEIAVLAHMRAYTAIRRTLNPHLHAALLLQIMQTYYGRTPIVAIAPGLDTQWRELKETLAKKYRPCEAVVEAGEMARQIMACALPEFFKAVGLTAIQQQLAHQAREGKLPIQD